MQITRTRTKYYLLGVLGALVMAGGVLALAPSAQAQLVNTVTVDKECSPNPVQIGQPLTCTIDVEPAEPFTSFVIFVRDTLPTGVTVTGATQQQFFDGVVVETVPCTVTGNTVECPPGLVTGELSPGTGRTTSLRVTIDATAEQCGTFTNTAEAVTPLGVTFIDTEQITVVGCEEAGRGGGGGNGGGGGGQQGGGGGQQGGGAAPLEITQETEQEAESGDVNQSFTVTSEGDNSTQCAGVQGVGQTGNTQNQLGLIQGFSEADDFEFDDVGSNIAASPESATTCDQQVNQAASASG